MSTPPEPTPFPSTVHLDVDVDETAATAPTPSTTRPAITAVAMRPTATLRAATAPTRAEMAERPSLITVVAWDDALLDQFGHDPRSPYVERFWLGVLGPSATWLLRSFAHHFDTEPDGFTLDLKDTARALGIGTRGGANGPLFRTMERVMAFGFARYQDESTLAVRRRMGPLNRRQQQRLPQDRQLEHDTWLATHGASSTPSADDMRRRARALALSLLELGEDLDATEQQLHRWRFHPAVAFDASRWAATVHQHRLAHRSADRAADIGTEHSPAGDAA